MVIEFVGHLAWIGFKISSHWVVFRGNILKEPK